MHMHNVFSLIAHVAGCEISADVAVKPTCVTVKPKRGCKVPMVLALLNILNFFLNLFLLALLVFLVVGLCIGV